MRSRKMSSTEPISSFEAVWFSSTLPIDFISVKLIVSPRFFLSWSISWYSSS